jgi:hypothetical protein
MSTFFCSAFRIAARLLRIIGAKKLQHLRQIGTYHNTFTSHSTARARIPALLAKTACCATKDRGQGKEGPAVAICATLRAPRY